VKRSVLTLLAASIAAWVPQAAAQSDPILLTVTVIYRERILPPPDATLLLELLDVSRADAPAIRLASQLYRLERVPQTETLHFDARLIDPRMSYSLSARILSSGATLFRTTESYPVISRGAPTTLEIVLRRTETAKQSPSGAPHIEGTQWSALEVMGRAVTVERPPSLSVERDGRFSLFAGCNRFAGQVKIEGSRIAFPKTFAGTTMACPEALGKLEKDVLAALADTVGFERNGKQLTFLGDQGTVRLRFRARPE